MKRHSFHIVMGESSESMRKLRLSTKFPHQEISEITIFYAVFIADFAYEVTGKYWKISVNYLNRNSCRKSFGIWFT